MVEKKDFCAKRATPGMWRFDSPPKTGALAGATVHNLYIPAAATFRIRR